MRSNRREISIFSMSALDLFASALGAFILLTVIMIPYFPNTGDSAERVADIKEELESEQAARAAAEEELEQTQSALEDAQKKIQELTQNRKIPPVDVMIAVDTTGSMENQVSSLKADIYVLSEILDSITDSAAIGVIDFKDRCEGSRVIRARGLKRINKANTNELASFVRQMQARNYTSCNTDSQEAIDIALNSAVGEPWRAESQKKVIIIVSDNAAYRSKWNSTFSQARAFRGRGGQVSSVFVRTQSTESDAAGYLKRLTEEGGGEYVLDSNSFLGSVLLAVLKD